MPVAPWRVEKKAPNNLETHNDLLNMLGRYSFVMPETVARGELRPLRNPIVD